MVLYKLQKQIVFITLTCFGVMILSCSLNQKDSTYSKKGNIIMYDNIIFTIYSSGLIGIQEKSDQNSRFKSDSIIKFSIREQDNQLIIKTESCILRYTKGANSILNRIQLEFKLEDAEILAYTNSIDKQNLGGLIKAVDKADGRHRHRKASDINSPFYILESPNGLLSRRGWTILKDVDGKLKHIEDKGESEAYFIFAYGHDYRRALQDFVNLNGKIPLLPKWSLGTWYSRYQPFKDEDYKATVARFRKEKIPIDVILPDMNWHKDSWFGLRVDQKNFPNMPEFLEWTNENGIHVGFNHHPGTLMKVDERTKPFIQNRLNANYDSLNKSTLAKYNKWGSWKFKDAIEIGYDNPDYVEPFLDEFFADLVDQGLDFHWVDGSPNVNVLERYFKVTENQAQKRTLVLTRQERGSFDSHRYPIGFSGDAFMSWASLSYNVELSITGANTGVYWSHDIGGHMKKYDNLDNSELFTRWVQSGALSPICRLHGNGGVELDDEPQHRRRPWLWGDEVLAISRKFIQLKYKFLPYTYSLNRKAYEEGLIMTYAPYIDYPQYNEAYSYGKSQYMFGPYVLVAPITNPSPDGFGMKGLGHKNLWIPEGTWYDYFTGETHVGPIESMIKKPIDEMPILIKEGAIIPMASYMEYTDEKPLDTLTIEFYQPSKAMSTSFNLYEDDGKSLEYENGAFAKTKIEYAYDIAGQSSIKIHPVKGDYKGKVEKRTYELVIKHIKELPLKVVVNDEELSSDKWMVENEVLIINSGLIDVSEGFEIIFK